MTIQRQYLLPNCTLTLEGLSNAVGTQELRPSLDTLMRFECHFAKLDQTLVGGLDFLESLIRATSECTQSWMSGVQHTKAKQKARQADQVQLQPAADGQFQMSVPVELLSAPFVGSEKRSVDLQLSTVQLFDLAEALDQLLTDSQTLPNLSPNIRPLSRREALSGQPLSKRAAPLALGTVSLAIAASVLYFIPAPEISRPKDKPVTTETPAAPGTPSSPTTGTTPAPETGASPNSASPESPAPSSPEPP
jgi:hypothetical protein